MFRLEQAPIEPADRSFPLDFPMPVRRGRTPAPRKLTTSRRIAVSSRTRIRRLDASSFPDRTRIFRPGVSSSRSARGYLIPASRSVDSKPPGVLLEDRCSPPNKPAPNLPIDLSSHRADASRRVRLHRLERSVLPFDPSIGRVGGSILRPESAAVKLKSRSIERTPGDLETTWGDFKPRPGGSKTKDPCRGRAETKKGSARRTARPEDLELKG
jgi:hypothetical protein